MNHLDGSEDVIVTVKVKEIRDKPGKPIYITVDSKLGNVQLLTDKRCVGNTDEDNFCKTCKLKFRCYSSDAIRVSVEKDLGNLPVSQVEPTIGELVEMFLAHNGVDLTKLAARAKIVEDEEAKRQEVEPEELTLESLKKAAERAGTPIPDDETAQKILEACKQGERDAKKKSK